MTTAESPWNRRSEMEETMRAGYANIDDGLEKLEHADIG